MCKRLKTLSRIALLLAVIGAAAEMTACAQARRTRPIPPDTPDDVRRQIGRLLSDDLTARIDATRNLGEMGARAAPAVPFLMDCAQIMGHVNQIRENPDRHPPDALAHFTHDMALGEQALEAIGRIGEPAVDPLIAMLKERESILLWRIVPLALAEIGEPAVEPLVNTLMARYDPTLSSDYAAEALGRIGTPGLHPLLVVLESEHSSLRASAIRGLGYIKDRLAVEALIGVLGAEDRHYILGQQAAISLSRIGSLAMGPLITALQDESPKVRTDAALALGYIGDARAIGPLAAALGDEEASVRYAAVLAFGRIENESTVEPLIAALGDKDAEIRSMTAFELGRKRDGRAVEPLARVLHADGAADVRSAAAGALGSIRDGRAVNPLISAFKDTDKWVVAAAATALSEIGDSRAVEPMIAVLADNNTRGWEEAVRELKYYGPDMAKPHVIKALGSFKDTRAIDILVSLLEDETSESRCSAAEALGTIGDSSALTPLAAALKDDVVDVRESAIHALAKLDDERAIWPLVPMLHDENHDVRESAAEALASIGTPAIEPLIESLKKRDDTFVRRSTRALSALRESFSLEKTVASYVDTDPYDSNYFAAQALKQITDKDFGSEYAAWREWFDLNRDDLYTDDMPLRGGG